MERQGLPSRAAEGLATFLLDDRRKVLHKLSEVNLLCNCHVTRRVLCCSTRCTTQRTAPGVAQDITSGEIRASCTTLVSMTDSTPGDDDDDDDDDNNNNNNNSVGNSCNKTNKCPNVKITFLHTIHQNSYINKAHYAQ